MNEAEKEKGKVLSFISIAVIINSFLAEKARKTREEYDRKYAEGNKLVFSKNKLIDNNFLFLEKARIAKERADREEADGE